MQKGGKHLTYQYSYIVYSEIASGGQFQCCIVVLAEISGMGDNFELRKYSLSLFSIVLLYEAVSTERIKLTVLTCEHIASAWNQARFRN